jgi:uncharacterized Tic20 family protein
MAEMNKNPEESSGGGDQSQQPQQGQQEQPGGSVSKDARTWAMLCHLLAIFTGFIAPLIIWLIKKDEDAFVNSHGKEALNFQITVAIAMVVSWLLFFVAIGCFLMPAVWIVNIVFCILASIKANSGQTYRYPVSIRFIK